MYQFARFLLTQREEQFCLNIDSPNELVNKWNISIHKHSEKHFVSEATRSERVERRNIIHGWKGHKKGKQMFTWWIKGMKRKEDGWNYNSLRHFRCLLTRQAQGSAKWHSFMWKRFIKKISVAVDVLQMKRHPNRDLHHW